MYYIHYLVYMGCYYLRDSIQCLQIINAYQYCIFEQTEKQNECTSMCENAASYYETNFGICGM